MDTSWFDNFVRGIGTKTAPFGFAPVGSPSQGPVDPAYNAGMSVLGDIGVRMLASGSKNPLQAFGQAYSGAKEGAVERNKNQYVAAQMLQEADAKKQERAREQEKQKWLEDQISQLPPQQQGIARMMPEKFFGAQIEQMFPKPGATTNTYVNVGGETPDAELRKNLDKQEGEAWSEYKKAGAVSGANNGDFAVLGELIKVAPQGPVAGNLAAMFPGVTSSGAAFQSVVKRVAPTLRVPGSGATSDIEYEGMLQSLPALANKPEANQLILEIMKAKADINVKRSQIITQYQQRKIDVDTARQMIADLDTQSIMTPELQAALTGVSQGDSYNTTSTGTKWRVKTNANP